MKVSHKVKSIITFKELRKELAKMGHALSTVCGICNKQHSTETVQGAPTELVQLAVP
jgi:hypothetical protein